ncbi:MAG: response regulator [Kiritimatiellae bacterium]|jgi:PAS domain S-box-containing protein|nr:response regulator [Kiritimatiellia bacterium]
MKPIKPEAQHPVPNILVVDDTPANLNLLAGMLKKHGYRVRPVPSGKLAIKAVQSEKPDLILLDIRMPEMSGYEVCTQLKADAALKDIPVIFISALAETADKIKAFTVGGVDYITKPFQFEEVEARVQTHLELRQLQIELEMQNDKLRNGRDDMESLLAKYTDLYDFAPVGYFSLDARGRIMEANLTGTRLLGLARSELLNQNLSRIIIPESRPDFLSFLERVFACPESQSCVAALVKEDGTVFWATFRGTSAFSTKTPHNRCRVAVSDITALKLAEEAQRNLDDMALTNQALQDEIIQRKAVEEDLRQSEQQTRLLMEQLRLLSRRILTVQEEERKRISRELHDEITQTLIGINVHLETLSWEAAINPKELQKKIARTQKLVEKSVDIAHQFAQELRPTVLDDLGLIPALHAFMKNFMKETGIRVTLNAFAGAEKLSSEKRTALYRVAQEALTNVARHARASRAEVSIRKLPDAVHMQIKDNGQSFEVDQILTTHAHGRLGLLGMRERVEMVGGTFSIESSPGSGTTIHAQIPCKKPAEENLCS